MAQGDRCSTRRRPDLELAEVIADRVVEIERAVLHELHHRDRSEEFGDRAGAEHRPGVDRSAAGARRATPGVGGERRLVPHDADGKPNAMMIAYETIYARVDGGVGVARHWH